MFWSVGPIRDFRVRSLFVSNCGLSGGPAWLSDPGRALYDFELLSITSLGQLRVAVPSPTSLTARGAVVVQQLVGDLTGQLYIPNRIDYIFNREWLHVVPRVCMRGCGAGTVVSLGPVWTLIVCLFVCPPLRNCGKLHWVVTHGD